MESFIRDSTDFLNQLPNNVAENSLHVSFDVENLYSNITHDLGMEATDYWLQKHPEEIKSRISKEFIKNGIKFILENNNFFFNGTYYNQVKGTATRH